MRLVKAAVMRSLDQEAWRRYGIPGIVLMENAGLSVVHYLLERFWDARPSGRKVLILAGPGNNGGDGLVVGRHLYNRGAGVEILLTAAPDSYQGDAAVNLKIVSAAGIPHWVFDADGCSRLAGALDRADLVVDALFGTGFRGLPQEPLASLIGMVNASGKPVLAVDLPSGMEADTGVVAGACIKADLTVTLGLPKLGLYLDPGAGLCRRGSRRGYLFSARTYRRWRGARHPGAAEFYLIDPELVAGFMPPRRPTDHKGSYGHVAVIGGAPGYTGAIALAGNAALRSGAGLVTAVVPASLYPVLAVKLTEVMTRPAPESSGGGFSRTAYAALGELFSRVTALAVGPGLGQDPETAIFLHDLLRGTELPTVIDADALNLLACDRGLLEDQSLRETQKPLGADPPPRGDGPAAGYEHWRCPGRPGRDCRKGRPGLGNDRGAEGRPHGSGGPGRAGPDQPDRQPRTGYRRDGGRAGRADRRVAGPGADAGSGCGCRRVCPWLGCRPPGGGPGHGRPDRRRPPGRTAPGPKRTVWLLSCRSGDREHILIYPAEGIFFPPTC